MRVDVPFKYLYIRSAALRKVFYYTKWAPDEVSGLGLVENKDNKFIVEEVFLLDQTNGAGFTDIHPGSAADLACEFMETGRDELVGKLKFWWHSHGHIGVLWSTTDEETISTLSEEYSFSLVINKDYQTLVRCDVYKPFKMTIHDISLIELPAEDDVLSEMCRKEVLKKTNKIIKRHRKKVVRIKDLLLEKEKNDNKGIIKI